MNWLIPIVTTLADGFFDLVMKLINESNATKEQQAEALAALRDVTLDRTRARVEQANRDTQARDVPAPKSTV